MAIASTPKALLRKILVSERRIVQLLLKNSNQYIVMSTVRFHKVITQIRVSTKLLINKMTITSIAKEMEII